MVDKVIDPDNPVPRGADGKFTVDASVVPAVFGATLAEPFVVARTPLPIPDNKEGAV